MRERKRTEKSISWKVRLAGKLIPDGKLRDAMNLYPGKTREEVKEKLCVELGRKLCFSLGIAVFLCMVAVSLMKQQEEQETGVSRPSPGEAPAIEYFYLENQEGRQVLELEIGALEYEETEIDKMHQRAEAYLEEVVPGANESLEKITENLNLPGSLPKTGENIYWRTDAPWLVEADGTIHNEELEETAKVGIYAEIMYGSEARYFTRTVTVYPKVYTAEEMLVREIRAELQEQEQATRTEEKFVVPESLYGRSLIRQKESSSGMGAFLVLLAVAVPLLVYSNYFSTLEDRQKKRKEEAEGCYSGFITKLSLLMAAGVSVRQAFNRLAGEYEKNYGKEHVLTMELTVTKQELETGYSEGEAYDAFGRRVGVLAYQRMASLLNQNASRGVQGIRTLLLQEAQEVMAQERANIKVKGEQAGTKLLFPMAGLLFLVFAILLVPAFQSF